ncbi:MAG: hypothetical protein WC162_01975 [Sphaerochaetaceae bacterium]
MAKESKNNLSGVEVLIVIFSTLIVLVILTLLTLKFIYPPEYFQIISKASQVAKIQIIQLSKIIGPFIMGLILLLIGTIIEEKHRNKIFTKVIENTEADKLIRKQLNPADDNLFRIIDEEPNPKTEKEKEYYTRKEKENIIKRKMEMELAEVSEENLEKPYKKNFISEFPNVYFYAEDDEIRVEEQNEDLLSKVEELCSVPEVKTPIPVVEIKEEVKKKVAVEITSTDEIIDHIIDSFSEDMEDLTLKIDSQEIEIPEKFIIESKEQNIEEDKNFIYPSIDLKPVKFTNDQIEADLNEEDLKIIGSDPQPKGIFYKNDLKKTYFTFEKYIKEELSSAIRLDYEICFFTIELNTQLSEKLSGEFNEGCECFILKNKTLFILPFYNKFEVEKIINKFDLQYRIIGKKNDYLEIKEALAI